MRSRLPPPRLHVAWNPISATGRTFSPSRCVHALTKLSGSTLDVSVVNTDAASFTNNPNAAFTSRENAKQTNIQPHIQDHQSQIRRASA